jgi:hypothetical protein
MNAFVDPKPAAAVLVGEGHAPVVAVLLAYAKRQTSPLLTPKDTDPRTLRLFPCKPAAFVGAAKGAMIRFMDPS